VGTVFLAAAIVLALYVITDVLFTTNLAVLTAVGALVVFAGLWYVVPMLARSSSEEEEDHETSGTREPSNDGRPQESRGASSRR
jgi:uncharacterized membrane protein HdeD (DUF308 family)